MSSSNEYPLSSTFTVPEALYFVFTEFASFGRHGVYKESDPEMDNANWAKFLRSCPNLIDYGITTSDIE